MSEIAQEIIKMRDKEKQKAQGFWYNLWQPAADLFCPREDQINTTRTPGEDKSARLTDNTGVRSAKKCASGMFGVNFPFGIRTIGVKVKNQRIGELPKVKEWRRLASELLYEDIFDSNFSKQANEALLSEIVFGTGNLFSEWDAKAGCLNFKEHAISTYTMKENNHGDVDTMILTFKYTTRQAIQQFGAENLDSKIVTDASELKGESNKYEFIYVVRPRTELNPLMGDNKNWPFESVYVDVKAEEVIKGVNPAGDENEAGFKEFPFHVARWEKGSNEKWGRGPGTDNLADCRMLQKMFADFIHMCNVAGLPPTEVLEAFEGKPNMQPGGVNRVQQMGSIRGIDKTALGDIRAVWEAIIEQRKRLEEAFYLNVFQPITQVEGTHRTAFEMQQRAQEAMKQLALPQANLVSDFFSPCFIRCLLLEIRWGRIPYPPMELMKVVRRTKTEVEIDVDADQLGIEYTGPITLALQNQQATGFQQWLEIMVQAVQGTQDPSIMDNVNLDDGFQTLGEALGVKSTTIATAEQIAAKRAARQKQQQTQAALQQAEVAAKAYKSASGAPEPGSPAEALMGAKQ